MDLKDIEDIKKAALERYSKAKEFCDGCFTDHQLGFATITVKEHLDKGWILTELPEINRIVYDYTETVGEKTTTREVTRLYLKLDCKKCNKPAWLSQSSVGLTVLESYIISGFKYFVLHKDGKYNALVPYDEIAEIDLRKKAWRDVFET